MKKLWYNVQVAGVAQSVVQLIRNQQVASSSLVTSSKNLVNGFPLTRFFAFDNRDELLKRFRFIVLRA